MCFISHFFRLFYELLFVKIFRHPNKKPKIKKNQRMFRFTFVVSAHDALFPPEWICITKSSDLCSFFPKSKHTIKTKNYDGGFPHVQPRCSRRRKFCDKIIYNGAYIVQVKTMDKVFKREPKTFIVLFSAFSV